MDPLIVLFGFGVGVLVGVTGMGGGSLMTPILIIVFGFKPVTAVGTDLAYPLALLVLFLWQGARRRAQAARSAPATGAQPLAQPVVD